MLKFFAIFTNCFQNIPNIKHLVEIDNKYSYHLKLENLTEYPIPDKLYSYFYNHTIDIPTGIITEFWINQTLCYQFTRSNRVRNSLLYI